MTTISSKSSWSSNYLILWFDQNPVELDPLGLKTCGGVEFVQVPSCRGSSQWIIGHVDNRSGFGEEDDSNTGKAEEREPVLVFNVL